MFAWKSERFLAVLREHIIFSIKWVEVRKMSEVYAWNNISKKGIPNMWFWIIYILVQISFFGGLLQGVSASALFWFLVVGQPWWPTFKKSLKKLKKAFTPWNHETIKTHHKKASYGTEFVFKMKQYLVVSRNITFHFKINLIFVDIFLEKIHLLYKKN